MLGILSLMYVYRQKYVRIHIGYTCMFTSTYVHMMRKNNSNQAGVCSTNLTLLSLMPKVRYKEQAVEHADTQISSLCL